MRKLFTVLPNFQLSKATKEDAILFYWTSGGGLAPLATSLVASPKLINAGPG